MQIHLIYAALGFPLWIRITHYINLLFIGLLIRSGIQIAGAHPRLYWNDNCTPGTEWLKFTKKRVPQDKLYTSMDDEKPVSPWLALPGGDNLGLGRHWHFFSILFWILNGVVYVVLLFATGEWTRLIPTSWSIIPRAWSTLITYLTFHIPPASDFHPFDPLQQLAYAGVVFILAPFMLLTGAAMSPAIEARFPWYIKLFGGRQVARSLHFLSMIAFLLFVIVHVALVLIVHFQDNITNIVLGDPRGNFWQAIIIAIVALLVVVAIHVLGTWYSLRKKRATQHALGTLVDPTRRWLLHQVKSKQHYPPENISPYFWVNGRPPVEKEFEQLVENDFADWRLAISGLVANPVRFSLADIKRLTKQTQITKHNCIQGWSGVAEWGGVPLAEILKFCGPLPDAKYLVLTSYQHGAQSYPQDGEEAKKRPFYEVIDMKLATHPQTILAAPIAPCSLLSAHLFSAQSPAPHQHDRGRGSGFPA